MERRMNRKLAATVSVAALCICGELGRSMLRPYIVTAQDGTIAPAENLIVAGVPAIPASLVETAGRYGSDRSATLADWSPTRREVVVWKAVWDKGAARVVEMGAGGRARGTGCQCSVAGRG